MTKEEFIEHHKDKYPEGVLDAFCQDIQKLIEHLNGKEL